MSDGPAERNCVAQAREAEEAVYRSSVPGMLEAIFHIVDEDRNNALSHTEFSEFMKGSKGTVRETILQILNSSFFEEIGQTKWYDCKLFGVHVS